MSPEEDGTRDAVDSEPKHYQRAIPAPVLGLLVVSFGSASEGRRRKKKMAEEEGGRRRRRGERRK